MPTHGFTGWVRVTAGSSENAESTAQHPHWTEGSSVINPRHFDGRNKVHTDGAPLLRDMTRDMHCLPAAFRAVSIHSSVSRCRP